MSWPGVWNPPANCSCGHRPHDGACPGRIAVRRGRPPVDTEIPCPCNKTATTIDRDAITGGSSAAALDSEAHVNSDAPGVFLAVDSTGASNHNANLMNPGGDRG